VRSRTLKALRSYSRLVSTDSARIHVLTPHRRQLTTTKLVTTKHPKTGKLTTKRVTTTRAGPKRKIELAALLHVTGNVLFGKKPADEHKQKQHKKKGKKQSKQPAVKVLCCCHSYHSELAAARTPPSHPSPDPCVCTLHSTLRRALHSCKT
jgi:hypothetical protein